MAEETYAGTLDQDTCDSCEKAANKGSKRWNCVMCCRVFHMNCRQGLGDGMDVFCRPCWKDHHGDLEPTRIIGRQRGKRGAK